MENKKFEVGFTNYKVLKKNNRFHDARKIVIDYIESTLSEYPDSIVKNNILYDIKQYYKYKRDRKTSFITIIGTILIPIELTLITTFLNVDIIKCQILNSFAVKFLSCFFLFVMLSISCSNEYKKYYDQKEYYDFCFNVICEYIEKKNFVL